MESVGNSAKVEIIVVDNDSSDDTKSMLENNFPEAQFIFCSPGVGFTKGINTAIQASSGEYILIATPSTQVKDDAILRLLNYLKENSAVGLVGPKILHADGTTQHSSKKMPSPKVAMLHTLYLFGLIHSSKILDDYFLFNYKSDQPIEVTSLTMSLLLVRHAVFEEVGFLDEDLFIWASDVDWCYEVEQTKWKQVFIPTIKVLHRRNSVSKKQPFTNLIHYHNDLKVFYRKHYAKQLSPLANLLWGIMLQVRFILLVIKYFFVKTDEYSYY
jgi:GT2 family glycosyltransferase